MTDKTQQKGSPPANDGKPPAKAAEGDKGGKKPDATDDGGGTDDDDDKGGGGGGGGEDHKTGDVAWREPIMALAGDNADRKALLEGFATFDDMAAALERGQGGDDWRERMAGGDAKLREELNRYGSEAEAGRALKEAKDRIRSGAGGASIPANDASPEDWAKFSTEHLGRPEKAEDIKVEPKLEDGEALTADEATIMAAVLGAAHKSGKFGEAHFQDLSQVVADLLVGGRKEMESRASAKKKEHEAALRKVYTNKADFDEAIGYANSAAAYACQQSGVDPEALAELQLADGTRLGDHELWARALSVLGRERGEDPTLTDNKPGGSLTELEAQLKAETAKRSGTAKEKAEYDTKEARDRRADLRRKIDRIKAAKR